MIGLFLTRALRACGIVGAVAAGTFVFSIAQAQDYMLPAGTPAHIRAAVESDARPEEDRARDAARRPAEVLALSMIEPGDHVIELGSFGNYYTRMLISAVGSDGHVDMIDLPQSERFGGEGGRAMDDMYANASYTQADYDDASFPSDVDVVYIVNHYHDMLPWEVDTATLNEKVFDALRSGGRYVVIDHKGPDGSGWDAVETHRIGVEAIVEEVVSAGFELEVDSDLLSHPEDDRTTMIFAPEMRGKTDRAVYIFRKP